VTLFLFEQIQCDLESLKITQLFSGYSSVQWTHLNLCCDNSTHNQMFVFKI